MGGSLITVNDDRRIQIDASPESVRTAFSNHHGTGFLGDLVQFVSDVKIQDTISRESVARIVVDVDPSLRAAATSNLVYDLGRVLDSAVTTFGAINDIDSNDLLLSMHESFDFRRLAALEDVATTAGCRWAPFWYEGSAAQFGPFFISGKAPSTRDLGARWVSTASNEQQGRALLRPPFTTLTSSRHDALERSAQLIVFLKDVSRWVHSLRPMAWWHTVRVDQESSIALDPVLPLPQRQLETMPEETGLNPMDVLNTRTGIVTRLRKVNFRTIMPPQVTYVESQTADMSRLSPWASNIHNAGSAWNDDEGARAGAIGEAIERYCGNVVDQSKLTFGSYDELSRTGRRLIDPNQLVLFSEKQYSNPRFPFVPFSRGARTHWVAGRSLVHDDEVYVPASLTYVNWNTGNSLFSPKTNPAYYPGIAAATNLEDAFANAIEEVVERDAAMVWWLSGHNLPTANDADSLLQQRVPAQFREPQGLHLSAIPLSNAVGLPAVAVVAELETEGILTVGLASRHTPNRAVDKALLEALGLVESALDMQDPEGGFWNTYENEEGKGAVRPMRSDRRYLDSYRPDFRDVTDLFCQLQIQLDPRSITITKKRVEVADRDGLSMLPHFDARDHKSYVEALSSAGYESIAVDLTTPDVASAGWHAVRVVIPGLVPNFPTAFPPLGAGRVQQLPARLGWRENSLTEQDIYSFPMPYA